MLDSSDNKNNFIVKLNSNNFNTCITESNKNEVGLRDYVLNKKIYNIPSFVKIYSDIDINIEKMKNCKNTIDNLVFKAKIEDGLLNFQKFFFVALDSEFTFTGSVALKSKPKFFNGFGIVSRDIGLLMRRIFGIDNDIESVGVLKGSMETSGFSVFEALSNLSANMEISLSSIGIPRFDLLTLSDKLLSLKLDIDPEDLISKKSILFRDGLSRYSTVRGGVLDIPDLKLSTIGATGLIKAKIDLKDWSALSIENRFKIMAKDPTKPSLLPLEIVYTANGPLDQLSSKFYMNSIHAYIKNAKNFLKKKNKQEDV